MAFCVLQFLLGKTERVTKMGCLWMNSMVYGRCNELVHGDYHGYSWFINQQTLVGGDWNHGIWIDFPIILGIIIIPTDFHIFQRGVVETTNQLWMFRVFKNSPNMFQLAVDFGASRRDNCRISLW